MENKMKDGMNDNRRISENHQQGIERVKQQKGSMMKGQGGKMGKVEEAHWNRSGSQLTPRKG